MNWKPVTGYEGLYEVSDTGLVRSLDRHIDLPGEKSRKLKGKIICPKYDKDGYQVVSLTKGKQSKSHFVHRLMAMAFVPNPDSLPQVNHRNGCKKCNSIDNLEWVSLTSNIRHAFDMGLNKNKGGSHAFATSVVDKELDMSFDTLKDWCEARDINYSTGKNIMNGRRKSKTIDMTKIYRVYKTRTNE